MVARGSWGGRASRGQETGLGKSQGGSRYKADGNEDEEKGGVEDAETSPSAPLGGLREWRCGCCLLSAGFGFTEETE